jgi:hypothetical protein
VRHWDHHWVFGLVWLGGLLVHHGLSFRFGIRPRRDYAITLPDRYACAMAMIGAILFALWVMLRVETAFGAFDFRTSLFAAVVIGLWANAIALQTGRNVELYFKKLPRNRMMLLPRMAARQNPAK